MSEPDKNELLTVARHGNVDALQRLFAEHEANLFRLVYRMLGNRADAQDLLQECWLRGQQGIIAFRGNASALKAWWFGIASHLALDYLRLRKRWRVEAQLIAEQESDSQPDEVEKLATMMSEPDFRYEVKEHIAFCFTCIGRTLDPTEEAALLLREVFEFSNADAARILDLSEPAFRRCYQCVTLRDFAPEPSKNELITRIEPAGGSQKSLAEALLDGRIAIARAANLEGGNSAKLHVALFQAIGVREESRNDE